MSIITTSIKHDILLAGFGGQGILFAGKLLAYTGLMDEKEVSWLPSYGPEMRGGTCNCSVCLSKEPIGSPMVAEPDFLVVMNQPSYEKFAPKVADGGMIFADSTMIPSCSPPDDNKKTVRIFEIPASRLAEENNLQGMANIILLGKLMRETGLFDLTLAEKALAKCVPPKKQNLIDANCKALSLGLSYETVK